MHSVNQQRRPTPNHPPRSAHPATPGRTTHIRIRRIALRLRLISPPNAQHTPTRQKKFQTSDNPQQPPTDSDAHHGQYHAINSLGTQHHPYPNTSSAQHALHPSQTSPDFSHQCNTQPYSKFPGPEPDTFSAESRTLHQDPDGPMGWEYHSHLYRRPTDANSFATPSFSRLPRRRCQVPCL